MKTLSNKTKNRAQNTLQLKDVLKMFTNFVFYFAGEILLQSESHGINVLSQLKWILFQRIIKLLFRVLLKNFHILFTEKPINVDNNFLNEKL